MRSCSIALALCVCLFCASQSSSQTASSPPTNSSSPQAITALQSAYSALARNGAVTDITLTGTAEWIAGTDDETGPVTYRALISANRLDLNLSSGPRTEIRLIGVGGPVGTWSGPDAVSHSIPYHNLLTDPGLFPLFAIANLNSTGGTILNYIGPETHNGANVIHISASQQPASSTAADNALLPHLTQVDIYLDPSTLLPVSYVFNVHPDDNELLDIPTEIRYSKYQSINGLQVPLRVQRYINNTLALDLQFQSISVNTNISVAQLTAQ